VTEHDESGFVYGKSYLGIERSDDLVIIQLTVSNTRTVAQKKALFARIVEKLEGTSKYDAFGACLAAVRIVTDFENDLSPTRLPFLPARGARGALRADSALMPQPSAPA